MVLERVPQGLRGELTRWMLELKAGVFAGTLSAVVRERLWEKVCSEADDGGCFLIYNAANEQGFLIHACGSTSRIPEVFEGLQLIRIPKQVENDSVEGEKMCGGS